MGRDGCSKQRLGDGLIAVSPAGDTAEHAFTTAREQQVDVQVRCCFYVWTFFMLFKSIPFDRRRFCGLLFCCRYLSSPSWFIAVVATPRMGSSPGGVIRQSGACHMYGGQGAKACGCRSPLA